LSFFLHRFRAFRPEPCPGGTAPDTLQRLRPDHLPGHRGQQPGCCRAFFREENWNLGRQILVMSWVTLVIGLGSFFSHRLYLPSSWIVDTLATAAAGRSVHVFRRHLPHYLINLVNYVRLLRRNVRIVQEANQRLEHPKAEAAIRKEQRAAGRDRGGKQQDTFRVASMTCSTSRPRKTMSRYTTRAESPAGCCCAAA